MPQRLKYVLRLFTALLATAIGLLMLAAPAEARVTVVPGAVKGGGTETFAFRLANERTDTPSNRVEIFFPQNPPIAFVEVAAVPGWTATVHSRPLNPPVTVDGKTISEVAGSVVLQGGQGGTVGPHQFEQFLITMGPLPADGRLEFATTQSYANGAVEQSTGTTAPVISIASRNAPGIPPQTAVANPGNPDSGLADPIQAGPATSDSTTGGSSTLAVMWGLLGLAVVIVALVGLRAYLRRRQVRGAEGEPGEPEHADEAHSSEVVTK